MHAALAPARRRPGDGLHRGAFRGHVATRERDPAMQLASLDHLVLTVADIPATVAFYAGVLGMTEDSFRSAGGPPRTALRFGVQKLNLHRAGAGFEPKATRPVPGSADLCFLSEEPLAAWLSHLAAMGVAVEAGPVARTGATGPLMSIYLRDPDGNLIEIANRG
jgi:catechol 2,3-dioxygenase-like lactoylglutathione lyase family enzyme